LSITYEVLTHHLKGFHLILASHLPGRDTDGWKLTNHKWTMQVLNQVDAREITQQEADALIEKASAGNKKPPPKVKIVTQFWNDIYALKEYFTLDLPPDIEFRQQNICHLLYGFADASGGGLGSTVLIPGTGIRYLASVCGSDDESQSSNYKEFENVVLIVEE
jgi:hypothetical protein